MSRYPQMPLSDPRFIQRVKDVQRALGLSGAAVDGKIGHVTLSLIEDKVLPAAPAPTTPPTPPAPPVTGTPTGVDERSARNILTLNPKIHGTFQRLAIEGTRIAREMGAGAYVMIGGSRTYAEQDALYAKGRTAPGPKVTNARGGYSNHNFAVAGDFGVFDAAGNYLDNTNPALASTIHRAVAAWAKANLPIEWGGDWVSFRDEPHYQYRTGLTTAQMRERVARGESVLS